MILAGEVHLLKQGVDGWNIHFRIGDVLLEGIIHSDAKIVRKDRRFNILSQFFRGGSRYERHVSSDAHSYMIFK